MRRAAKRISVWIFVDVVVAVNICDSIIVASWAREVLSVAVENKRFFRSTSCRRSMRRIFDRTSVSRASCGSRSTMLLSGAVNALAIRRRGVVALRSREVALFFGFRMEFALCRRKRRRRSASLGGVDGGLCCFRISVWSRSVRLWLRKTRS